MRPLSNITLAINRAQNLGLPMIAPDELDNLDIWWDPSDSGNRTLTAGEFTTLTNKGDGGTATLLGPVGSSTSGYGLPTILKEAGIEWANFDGTDVLRLVGTNTVYPRGNGSCSFVAVFRTTQNSGFVTFFEQGLTTGSSPGWLIGANHTGTPDTWQFAARDDSLSETENLLHTDASISDGETHTLIGVRDNAAGANGEVILYLDGVAVTSAALTSGWDDIDEPYTSPWEDLLVASRPAGGSTVYQSGSTQLLGDMLIYGDALTADEAFGLHNYLLNKWSDPTGFLPTDIADLTVWMDAQDNGTIDFDTSDAVTAWRSRVGNVAWNEGNSTNQPSMTQVVDRQMMSFDGSNDYLDFDGTDPEDLQPGSDDFTIVAVFRATDTDRGILWINDDGAGKRWLLRTHSAGTDLEFSIDDNTTAQTLQATSVDYSDGTVRVVIASRDGTNLRLYYGDGGSLTEDSASPVSIGTYGDLGSGVNPGIGDVSLGGGQALAGQIGELLFYKHALTSQERADLYAYLVDRWSL